jgi:hypothetical protein
VGLSLNLGPLSLQIGRQEIEKRSAPLPPGAIPNKGGTDAIRAQIRQESQKPLSTAFETPAGGQPPDPGPTPLPRATERVPLRYEFPVGYNTTAGAIRRGRLTPFEILRTLAKTSDVIRICIETRKDQICSLNWDIAVKKETLAGESDLITPTDDVRRRIEAVRIFFSKPDKRRSFSTWLRMAIEEVLVIDALSIYKRRTRGAGSDTALSGDVGRSSKLFALEIKDGSTIVPLIDEAGDTPLPPSIAYRQVIQGIWLEGGDCSADDLLYRPRTVLAESPYGLSPTEAVLLAVNAAINRELFNLSYYSEGNIPRALLDAPEGWGPDQIGKMQQYLDDLLAGNLGARSRMRVVGNGMAASMKQFTEPDFDTKWDEWLLKIVCAAFAVPPSEVGFTNDVNKATGEQQENVVYRRGVKPLGLFLKEIFDDVIAIDLNCPDLEFRFSGGESEDRYKQAQTDEIYLRRGCTSIDEVRARDGKQPLGVGPMIDTPQGPVTIEELLAGPMLEEPMDPNNPAPPADDGQEAADTNPEQQAQLEAEAQKDLAAWRRCALNDVKKGKRPRTLFRSDALPAEKKLEVRLALTKARSAEDVGAVFDKAKGTGLLIEPSLIQKAEYRTLTGMARTTQTRMNQQFRKFFSAQGKALARFLSEGVEGQ